MKSTSLLALSLVAFASACGSKTEDKRAPEPKMSTLQIGVNEGRLQPPPDGLWLEIDGKPLGELVENRTTSLPFEAPEGTYGLDLVPRIKAKLETTCGKEAFPVRPHYERREEETEFFAKYATATTRNYRAFYVDGLRYAILYIDNVGGKARVLKVGETTIELPADKATERRVRLGSCATARAITIDGQPAGEVSTQSKDAKDLPATLVDAVGGRCYRSVLHFYKDVGTPDYPTAPPPPSTLKGARAYPIEHPSDFLQKSPKEFIKYTPPFEIDLPGDVRRELNRCEGSPKPGGALR